MAMSVKDKVMEIVKKAHREGLLGKKISRSELILLFFEFGLYSPSSHEKYIRLLKDLQVLSQCPDGKYVISDPFGITSKGVENAKDD